MIRSQPCAVASRRPTSRRQPRSYNATPITPVLRYAHYAGCRYVINDERFVVAERRLFCTMPAFHRTSWRQPRWRHTMAAPRDAGRYVYEAEMIVTAPSAFFMFCRRRAVCERRSFLSILRLPPSANIAHVTKTVARRKYSTAAECEPPLRGCALRASHVTLRKGDVKLNAFFVSRRGMPEARHSMPRVAEVSVRAIIRQPRVFAADS